MARFVWTTSADRVLEQAVKDGKPAWKAAQEIGGGCTESIAQKRARARGLNFTARWNDYQRATGQNSNKPGAPIGHDERRYIASLQRDDVRDRTKDAA